MAAPLGSVHVHAIFDGKTFVPSEPLDLPVGTVLDGVVKPLTTQEEWLVFLDSVQGAWGDYDFVEPEELPYEPEDPLD